MRSIIVRLRRKTPSDIVEPLRLGRTQHLTVLARKAARWVADHIQEFRPWDGEVPSSLHDRAADNWRPLLAISDIIGGEWPALARDAARSLTSEADDKSAASMLLGDIHDLFSSTGRSRLSSQEIVTHLTTLEHRPWPEWKAGKAMTVRQLARQLKPFGIGPSTIRQGDGTMKGYNIEAFGDAFRRYLPQFDPSQRNAPKNSAKNAQISSGTPEQPVPDDFAKKPQKTGMCDGVTDQNRVKPEAPPPSGANGWSARI